MVSRARRQRAGARAGRCARRHHRHQAGHHPQRRCAGPDAHPLRHLGRGRLAVAPGHRQRGSARRGRAHGVVGQLRQLCGGQGRPVRGAGHPAVPGGLHRYRHARRRQSGDGSRRQRRHAGIAHGQWRAGALAQPGSGAGRGQHGPRLGRWQHADADRRGRPRHPHRRRPEPGGGSPQPAREQWRDHAADPLLESAPGPEQHVRQPARRAAAGSRRRGRHRAALRPCRSDGDARLPALCGHLVHRGRRAGAGGGRCRRAHRVARRSGHRRRGGSGPRGPVPQRHAVHARRHRAGWRGLELVLAVDAVHRHRPVQRRRQPDAVHVVDGRPGPQQPQRHRRSLRDAVDPARGGAQRQPVLRQCEFRPGQQQQSGAVAGRPDPGTFAGEPAFRGDGHRRAGTAGRGFDLRRRLCGHAVRRQSHAAAEPVQPGLPRRGRQRLVRPARGRQYRPAGAGAQRAVLEGGGERAVVSAVQPDVAHRVRLYPRGAAARALLCERGRYRRPAHRHHHLRGQPHGHGRHPEPVVRGGRAGGDPRGARYRQRRHAAGHLRDGTGRRAGLVWPVLQQRAQRAAAAHPEHDRHHAREPDRAWQRR
ncbi:hypothetical protein D3C72_910080 [compost metagenome]